MKTGRVEWIIQGRIIGRSSRSATARLENTRRAVVDHWRRSPESARTTTDAPVAAIHRCNNWWSRHIIAVAVVTRNNWRRWQHQIGTAISKSFHFILLFLIKFNLQKINTCDWDCWWRLRIAGNNWTKWHHFRYYPLRRRRRRQQQPSQKVTNDDGDGEAVWNGWSDSDTMGNYWPLKWSVTAVAAADVEKTMKRR